MRKLVLLILGAGLAFSPFSPAWATCTDDAPCTMTLYAKGSTDELHLAYGDTLVIKQYAKKTEIIPAVKAWKAGAIDTTPVVVFDTAGDLSDSKKGWLVPGLGFSFESTTAHIPDSNKEHISVKLYKSPSVDDEWILVGQHKDGSVHGGRAHMTN